MLPDSLHREVSAREIKRPVLRYHGGKFKIANWIIPQLPNHATYVEPFGGAASILLRKSRVSGEIYNDLDGTVVNVFRVLQSPEKAAELYRLLRVTPFSRAEFKRSYEEPVSDIDAAHKAIIRSFMGFSTDALTRGCATGFRANKTRGKLPAQEWSTYPNFIATFVERLRGVVIEQRNAFEVINAYDSPETLFFVDPPYVSSTRGDGCAKHGYKYEFSNRDHEMLSTALRGVRGKVVLCGYYSSLYDRLYGDWRTAEHKAFANGSHPRTEMLWMNYEEEAA
jgi:DNA adenine methylase